jgi:hypothetical protein
MLTAVSYGDGDCRLIRAEQLDELIASAAIKQFLRLEGWVTIGCNPVRVKNDNQLRRERRQQAVSLPDTILFNLKLHISGLCG